MRVLIVEDEARLAASLRKGLVEEGYLVDVATDGERAEVEAKVVEYDALIVDWRLPRLSGVALIRRLRSGGCRTPILLLTALAGVERRVEGLDAGADDYLTKPFAFEELLARLRAILRRPPQLAEAIRRLGGLELDSLRRRASFAGRPIPLRPKEMQLLDALMRQPGRVLSRTALAEAALDDADTVGDNLIDVTVSQLRAKLTEAQAGAGTVAIETVRGAGYRLVGGDDPERGPS